MLENEVIACGIDEAGRGCIAGSLFVCGVVLPLKYHHNFKSLGIRDSKQLNLQTRTTLAQEIEIYLNNHNGFFHIVSFDSIQIDSLGLRCCMQKALKELLNFAYSKNATRIVFDGNTNFGISSIQTLIKGDNKDVLIGAASILAKHNKDSEMLKLHQRFPQYDFNNNKGYLTKSHREKILQHGYSQVHRKSYHIKSFHTLF